MASTRAPFACLLLIALCVPLLPTGTAVVATKHVVYLGLAVAGMGLVWLGAARRGTAPLLGTPTDGALGVFALTALPALLVAANPGMARYELGVSLAWVLTYVLAIKSVRTPGQVRALYGAALLAALAIAALGLARYGRFVAAGSPEGARSEILSTPLFAHSYLAAQYLVMVFTGGLVIALERGLSRAARGLVAAALLPVGVFLLVIGSRGAYLAVLAALAAHVLLRAPGQRADRRTALLAAARRLLRFGLALAAVLGVAALSGLLPGAVSYALARLALFFDPSAVDLNYSRLAVWWHSVRMAAEHPLFGVGLGSFDTVFPSFHYAPRPVPHAHNQFLHVLAERGLLGLLALGFLLRHALRAARRGSAQLEPDDSRRVLFHAAATSLAAALAYFCFETPLVWAEAGSLIVILLAIMTRAGCASREGHSSPLLLHAGLAAALACLSLAVPTWALFERSTAPIQRHLELRAQAARSEDPSALRAGLERSLPDLERAEAGFPHRADLTAMRAGVLTQLGRLDEAIEAHLRADRRQPGSFLHLNAAGMLLLRAGRHAEAADALRRAIRAHRGAESAPTYEALGRALLYDERHEEAWLVFRDLIEDYHYHEQHPTLLLDAARTLIQLDRTPRIGLTLVQRYLRREPQGNLERAARLERELETLLARPRRATAPLP